MNKFRGLQVWLMLKMDYHVSYSYHIAMINMETYSRLPGMAIPEPPPMIYENGTLKRILVDGGYYENGKYYFYIQDHLGNNRVVADQNETVVQSTQYYPFGMSFADGVETSKQPYKYGGKELDKERGLNWYDFEARNYDTALGRFTTVDPMAEKYYGWSPYAYVMNNPLNAIDPDGCSTWVMQNEDGTYRIVGGDLDDDDYNIYVYSIQDGEIVRGESIGETTSLTSFYDTDSNGGAGAWSVGSIINPDDRSGDNFLSDFAKNLPDIGYYMENATNNRKYDFKATNGTNT